jgi:hypothetical protein
MTHAREVAKYYRWLDRLEWMRQMRGRTGNAAGVGPMPVPGPDGRMRRLMAVASLSTNKISARPAARAGQKEGIHGPRLAAAAMTKTTTTTAMMTMMVIMITIKAPC